MEKSHFVFKSQNIIFQEYFTVYLKKTACPTGRMVVTFLGIYSAEFNSICEFWAINSNGVEEQY